MKINILLLRYAETIKLLNDNFGIDYKTIIDIIEKLASEEGGLYNVLLSDKNMVEYESETDFCIDTNQDESDEQKSLNNIKNKKNKNKFDDLDDLDDLDDISNLDDLDDLDDLK